MGMVYHHGDGGCNDVCTWMTGVLVLILECIWGRSITMETVGAMMCVQYPDDWCASIGVHMGMVLQRSPWDVSTWKHQCSVSNINSWGGGGGGGRVLAHVSQEEIKENHTLSTKL